MVNIMTDKEKLASVENSLVQRYNERGYLVEDEVIDCCVDHDLDLAEIDAVCDRLLKRNIIFRDSATDTVSQDDDDEDDVYDRSHLDYDEVLNQISREYPACKSLIEQIRSILPPQHKEWRTLIGEAQNGNMYARERLVLMYLRTILKRAYDFSKIYYCDFEECFQNAVIGFLNAIEKYDVTSPDSFVSYFSLWLVQNMNRECSIKGTIMRYPVHYKDKLLAVMSELTDGYFGPDELAFAEQRIIDKYEESSDYTGINREIADLFNQNFLSDYLKVAGGQVDYNHILPYLPIFDEYVTEDDLGDRIIESDNAASLRLNLDSCLTNREKSVIVMRYGIDDGEPKTLEEVGAAFGVTRERIRQIESKAIKKLKRRYHVLSK